MMRTIDGGLSGEIPQESWIDERAYRNYWESNM